MHQSSLQQFITKWSLAICVLLCIVGFNVPTIWLSGVWRFVAMAIVLGVMVYICRRFAITQTELGLQRSRLRQGLLWGLACMGLIVLVLGLTFLVDSTIFIDSRYHVSWLRAIAIMFVVIPLQTVLFEEFIFRGLLLASFRRHLEDRWAVLAAAVVFGLWHIVPSLHLASSSKVIGEAGSVTPNAQLSAITVTVIATTIAGIFLGWLRLRSTSLVAPIIAHWSINAVSVALVVLAYAQR